MIMVIRDFGERMQTKETRNTRSETCFNPENGTKTLNPIGPD